MVFFECKPLVKYRLVVDAGRIEHFAGGGAKKHPVHEVLFRNGVVSLNENDPKDLAIIKFLVAHPKYNETFRHWPQDEIKVIDGRQWKSKSLPVEEILANLEERPPVQAPPRTPAPRPQPTVEPIPEGAKADPVIAREGPRVRTGVSSTADLGAAPPSKYSKG